MMEAFGPAPMRAGLASGDHTSLSSSMYIHLGSIAVDRLGEKNKAASSIASDIRTYEGEFDPFGFNSISQIRLKVGKNQMVTNRVTGREEVVDTLLSAEGEPAETWIYEGEAGGRVYTELLDKYHKVAESSDDVTAVWVSNREENDHNVGKNSRIYKLEKKDQEVVLTSYTVPGSEESMWDFMDILTNKQHERKGSLHGTTAFFSQDKGASHEKIYAVLSESLKSDELKKGEKYLQRFREELEISDDDRDNIARLKEDRIKVKLLENEDVKTGLALMANAIVNTILGGQEQKSRQDDQNTNIIRSLAQGLIAIPGYIDHTGRLVKQDGIIQQTEDNNFPEIGQRASKETYKTKQVITQVIEPVIPGLIGLSNLFINLSEDEVDQHVELLCQNQKSYSNDLNTLEESIFWQEFITAIFEPIPDLGNWVKRDINTDSREPIPSDYKPDFISEERNFQEALLQLFPMFYTERENEAKPSQNIEGLKVLKRELQQGLEVIGEIIKDKESKGLKVEQKEEKTRQHKVEIKVVDIGEEIILKMFKDVRISQYDAFPQLAFLLFTYNDRNSSEAVKQLISTLIYRQVEIIFKDKSLISRFPQLEVIFEKFRKLSPQAQFLEDRFEIIIAIVEQLYSKDSVFKNVENDQDFLRKLIFLICKIIQLPAVIEDYSEQNFNNLSIERLRLHNLTGNNIHYLFKYNKKNRQKLAKTGIIYSHPTCFTESLYDKIERKG